MSIKLLKGDIKDGGFLLIPVNRILLKIGQGSQIAKMGATKLILQDSCQNWTQQGQEPRSRLREEDSEELD